MWTDQILTETAHRPWALPTSRFRLRQIWHDLLFIHWAVPAAHLRALIPPPLQTDTYHGQAYLGVVPFRMTEVTFGNGPVIPAFSRFAELNVRTYVTHHGRPGVYFFSLDAGNPVMAWIARRWYHLPYAFSRMRLTHEDHVIHYKSMRRRARFEAHYWPTGPVFTARPGTLDYWLTERYCLYTVRAGIVSYAQIHHPPWPLQPAYAKIVENTMAESHGIALPETPPLLHFAARQPVVVWTPQVV